MPWFRIPEGAQLWLALFLTPHIASSLKANVNKLSKLLQLQFLPKLSGFLLLFCERNSFSLKKKIFSQKILYVLLASFTSLHPTL